MSKIFGAKAKVYIRFDRDIKELAEVLSRGLILSDFTVEHREEPPYDLTGSCEALGFELWLNESTGFLDFNFLLEIETEMSNDELGTGQMHDLSLWLARFISKICGINTFVASEDGEGMYFYVSE